MIKRYDQNPVHFFQGNISASKAPNYFIIGNEEGKYQPPETLPGYERPYLEEKYHSDIYFNVENGQQNVYKGLSTMY